MDRLTHPVYSAFEPNKRLEVVEASYTLDYAYHLASEIVEQVIYRLARDENGNRVVREFADAQDRCPAAQRAWEATLILATGGFND